MIFAIALGSNITPLIALEEARTALDKWGRVEYSPIFELPDRRGVGPFYCNQASLLHQQDLSIEDMENILKQIEDQCGRIRGSLQVRMDLDLIAYGPTLEQLQLVAKRLPLPVDVTLPMQCLWPDCASYALQNSLSK